MFKKITLFVFLFLVVGIGCFALIERDNTNANLNTQIDQMEKTYSGKLDSMTAYQNVLVDRIESLQNSLSQLRQSYDELNQTYQNAVAQYTLDLEELNAQLVDVQNALSELQASSDVDKAKIEELQNKVSELQQSISEKNVIIDQLNEAIQTQQATIDELNTTIDELVAELNSDLKLDFYIKLMEGEITDIKASDLDGVTKIRDYAFYKSNVTSVEFPTSLVELGEHSFECSKLTQIEIPSTITKLGNYCFNECRELLTATVNINNISEACFQYCVKLVNVNINSVDIIDSYAFQACSSITNISFGSNLITLGGASFNGCLNLTTINLENTSVEDIGSYCFNATNLSYFKLPSSLKFVGERVFDETPWFNNLSDNEFVYKDNVLLGFKGSEYPTTVVVEDGTRIISKSCFHYSWNACLENIVLPNSLEVINDHAFNPCNSVTSLVLPENVSYIGEYGLPSNLTTLTVKALEPPTLSYCSYLSSPSTIYIPAESLSAYQNAMWWSNYSSKFVELPAETMEDTDTTVTA